MRFTAFLVAAAPFLASAWKLELFEQVNQVGLIYELAGRADHDCHNLPVSARNRARSYRWNSDGVLLDNCEVIVYRDLGCNRKLFGTGQQDSNDNLSGGSIRNIESFKVNC